MKLRYPDSALAEWIAVLCLVAAVIFMACGKALAGLCAAAAAYLASRTPKKL